MFQVIDLCGRIYDAYGTFIDEDGSIQFILCDDSGEFFKTDNVKGFYELYKGDDLSSDAGASYVEPKTNIDKIRAMSDKKFTDWLCQYIIDTLDASGMPHSGIDSREKEKMLMWLQQYSED